MYIAVLFRRRCSERIGNVVWYMVVLRRLSNDFSSVFLVANNIKWIMLLCCGYD